MTGTARQDQRAVPVEPDARHSQEIPRPVEQAGRRRLRAAWNALVGVIGGVVGLAPHVLHHIGFLAGAALVAGAAGTVLFGAVGLLVSVPFLLRLRRRFGTWRAPAIALVVFAAMFSISAFVIGPAINSDGDTPVPRSPSPTDTVDHDSHH